MKRRGLLVVISAPSGGGKTTIIRKVLAATNENYRYSISATTRERRENEVDGRDYFFLSEKEFERKKRQGEFVEWAEVHGDFYATPREHLDRWLDEGRIVLLDLDVDGGLEIKNKYSNSAILIFVKPPSFQSLIQRLKNRKTESDAEIEKRLQRYPKEIQKADEYDYQIVNQNLDDTVKEIVKIVNSV
ncbi:guanylate kinase [candidate division KSB1 bacterium]|nr:guanylate kinase [candidate division KSB1 bacterium]NIR72266.1 guanylate kinase [candidate division KSB1 bacterium]NIS24237.1 guanylate kinase [candidate division KSB1 bacterium]NIT71151.1 guanylate kinase [candidate division KSB1 bacterium]NIU24856.1 guanylate kinase [candidate division KSB1 bacterium]